MWYDQFDYFHVTYLPRILSDHSPMLLEFPGSPRPPPQFQFCDLWTRHPTFLTIVTRYLHQARGRLDHFLKRLQHGLRKLNRDHYADLREQQQIARNRLTDAQRALSIAPEDDTLRKLEVDARDQYIRILSSSIDLIKQQSKAE